MENANVSAIARFAPFQFIRESLAELRKVSWPSRAEAIKLTAVVIALSVIVGVFIGGTDLLFLRLSTYLFQQ
jgi:preprotein translocase subunit SecE